MGDFLLYQKKRPGYCLAVQNGNWELWIQLNTSARDRDCTSTVYHRKCSRQGSESAHGRETAARTCRTPHPVPGPGSLRICNRSPGPLPIRLCLYVCALTRSRLLARPPSRDLTSRPRESRTAGREKTEKVPQPAPGPTSARQAG